MLNFRNRDDTDLISHHPRAPVLSADVAVDVAAPADRAGADPRDRGDHLLQVALEHAVQLESLRRGTLQKGSGGSGPRSNAGEAFL